MASPTLRASSPPTESGQNHESFDAFLVRASTRLSRRAFDEPPGLDKINVADRDIDAHVFTLRLGPYVELPLNDKFSVFLNGGLTLGVGYTKFSYNETVTISDPAYDVTLSSRRRRGAGSETDFLVGAYAGAGLSYALTKEINLFTSAQYQAAGHTTNREGGKEAILDLGQSIIVAFGVSYSF